MALLVDKRKTYERIVKDPDDGTEYTVNLRKMTEGDSQRRSDLATRARLQERRKKGKKRTRGNEDTLMEYAFGAIRQFDLETSIVGWSFPFELDTSHIRRLDPDVADQIHNHIEELNPFIFSGREEEDDELPDEDESEASEASEATANGHEEDVAFAPANMPADVEQVFGEEEGPTQHAAES